MAQRQHEEMVAQGVKAMLATILTDIQAPGQERQLQGLKALQGLARNAAMFLPLQAAFREAGGFPLLVRLLDAAMPPLPRRRPALRSCADGHTDASDADAAVATGAAADHADSDHTGGGSDGSDGSGGSRRRDGEAVRQDVGGGKQEAAAWDADFGAQRISPAVEALTMLARNNPKNRAAAIQAGAVPALCSILQAGAARAVPIALDDVLKALYALAAADASGNSASELFASGGIHSLVQLLGAVVEEPQNAKCRVWARELVELLYPLAARSRIVAALLLQELPVFVRLLTTLADPLTLSLGLDVFEELLAALGSRARTAIAAEGGLAPLVRLLHMGGLGGKAALLLAALMGGPAAAPAATLRALLQPPDLAALVHIALLASHAQDLDAEACRQLLEVLVSGPELGVVRALLLARDCGPCLSMPGVADRLADRLASEEGLLLLASIGARHPVEAALAAAELLPHRPQAAARALLRGGRVGTLVAAALAEAAGEPTAGALENGNSPPLGDGADCIRALADALAYLRGRDGSSPPATVGPPEADAVAHRGHENGTHEGDMTFVVSGREVRTARAAIATASSVVAAALSRVEVGSDTKVVVPPIPGMDPSRLPDTFELLLACLSGPPPSLKPGQVVDLWRLASALQTAGPKAAAEAALPAALADASSTLPAALAAAAAAGPSGERVAETALLHLAGNLIELHADGSLAALAADFPDMLHSGLAAIMSDLLQPLAPGPPSRAASSSDLSRSFSRRSASGFLPGRSGSFSNELGAAASAASSFLPARSPSLASEAGFGAAAASNFLTQRSASLASEAGLGTASFSSRDVFPGSGAGGSLAGGSFLSGSAAGGSAAGSQPVTPSGASSVSVSPLAADRRLGPFGQPPLPPLPETAAATDVMQQSANAAAAAATAGGSPASSASEHSPPRRLPKAEAEAGAPPAHPAAAAGSGPAVGSSPPPPPSPSSEDALNRLSQALRF